MIITINDFRMKQAQISKKKSRVADQRHFITIKGARTHNLKSIDVCIPKNKLIAVTGLSGSGKSTLVMDTLYAEGQRRYVESLSSYARQFLDRMKKPEVDFIHGICPAIAIEQRVSSGSHRSTVGSMTEIFDYLRLLYGTIGKCISPISGTQVQRDTVTDVVNYVGQLAEGQRMYLVCPFPTDHPERTVQKELDILLQKGYTRIRYQENYVRIEEWLSHHKQIAGQKLADIDPDDFQIVIDRFVVSHSEDALERLADSAQTAFVESHGVCLLVAEDGHAYIFNNHFERDGILFVEPDPKLFNYNNSFGACPTCEGYGKILGISPQKVIPDISRSVYDDCVACWRSVKGKNWLNTFLNHAHQIDFPVHTPYEQLTERQVDILWNGSKYTPGIYQYFDQIEKKKYKIQNRVLIARYRGRTTCPDCQGTRLRKEALYIQVGGLSIDQVIQMPIDQMADHFSHLQLSKYDRQVAERILLEINNRLHTMLQVGLNYLKLDRLASSLSGGETQRIHLTRTLGSNLTASLYILDEPSIGLHPRDTEQLIMVLKKLRDLGNTVVVVEHEEEVILAADHLIDLGPKAGIHGGALVFSGSITAEALQHHDSLTLQYLSGRKKISVPQQRRQANHFIKIGGASLFNLKNITVRFPLNTLCCVTGVSGSGKTTLVKSILYPALKSIVDPFFSKSHLGYKELEGDLQLISRVELINQKPIGKSSRSNPATYVKAYDSIRNLMAAQPGARIQGLSPKHFSFNVEAGRCEECKGEGEITVEMQFLADVKLICEHCKGRRFDSRVLEVEYRGKNIFDILNLSIEEAMDFFKNKKDIIRKIKPLFDVGLGYVQLGQSSNTLSGGEAQRVKLASYLGIEKAGEHIVFIFDEPTTGLHFDDIHRLLYALNALVEQGHTVIVVEHNLEVIKNADWVIDLGPEGGDKGGDLLYEGTPEGLIQVETSYTAKYLKDKL